LIDDVFTGQPVSGYLLDPIRGTQIDTDEHDQDGYRRLGFVSYPCFTTTGGVRVELRDGVWDGSAHRQNLKLINIPVFKHHNGSAITGALKHTYGILSMSFASGSYHYSEIGNATGDMFSVVRAPVLNVIDCIWVSPGALSGFPEHNTVRTDRLLAGIDPVALDYYAGKQVLYPAGGDPYHHPDMSSDYQAFMTQARDRINANGGINGQAVSFDEADFVVVSADASVAPPVGVVHAVKASGEVRIQWSGGSPPYRIWRSESKQFSSPVLLTECCQQQSFVDTGALADGRSYYYLVE
jgi:hypothetical protein